MHEALIDPIGPIERLKHKLSRYKWSKWSEVVETLYLVFRFAGSFYLVRYVVYPIFLKLSTEHQNMLWIVFFIYVITSWFERRT